MKRGVGAALAAVLVCLLFIGYRRWSGAGLPVMPENPNENVQTYLEKAELLREQAVTDEVIWELGNKPAGDLGHVVFFSISDSTSRSSVYKGTGEDLSSAWESAVTAAAAALQESGLEPVWVKADIVYISEALSKEKLSTAIRSSRPEFFRYGVAFDKTYQTALLEAEMNGAKLYQYETGEIDLKNLNEYLKNTGQRRQRALPKQITLFRTFGWFCGEDCEVYPLDSNALSFGRRKIDIVDKDCTEQMIRNASDFLAAQVQEDGTFLYGYYPCFDEQIEDYNIVCHASTILALLHRYQMEPDEELAKKIDKTVEYMLGQIIYEDNETAYLYEKTTDEIKLGGCGVAVLVLTEYMDIFQSDQYREICRYLGNGMLKLLNQETGEYYHVLNGDFSQKEAFRTVYYDGEATFALCRLYGLTGEELWLEAAKAAVEHFIRADYTQYKDHWVAYSMNEITKYVTDNESYYAFALRNIQENLEEIYEKDTTYCTYLELLMASFELYDRMIQSGAAVDGFHEDMFLKTIYARAKRMLDGYFYPEYAMYMENPQRILGSFMVRQDAYRVRIDDVQHNISGYYLYYNNYDRLKAYGMLETVD